MSRRDNRKARRAQSLGEQVSALYARGLRDAEIAEELGISVAQARKHRRRNGKTQREAEPWGAA